MVTHPASSLAQDRESSTTETSILTTICYANEYEINTEKLIAALRWPVGATYAKIFIISGPQITSLARRSICDPEIINIFAIMIMQDQKKQV